MSEVEGHCRAKSRHSPHGRLLDFARRGPSTALGQAGLLLLSTPLHAQPVTTSPAPDAVSVSIYRAPERGRDEAMELSDLRGFALVTETRRVSIPAGDGIIRFEGVAGGILPESAIVTGLPEGVVEKNQDANLLSPASLLGAATGRRVTLKRTARATGKVTEQDAVIRSGPDGQVVLQTPDGIEALRCAGIPETIVYNGVPEGLSAKPVLSVRTSSTRAATATVTLSYLADNFDWQANYVGTLAKDGKSLDLFGWVTLASADETSFARAQAMVIAGRLNRANMRRQREDTSQSVNLTCWRQGTTSDIPLSELERYADGAAYPPPPPPPAPMMESAMAITVTGSRRAKAMTAVQEDLGDLKLYRIPEPVTVAANAQKQVGLLDKPRVPVTLVYRADVYGEGDAPVRLTLRARNRTADGLGLPLPAGKVAVYQPGSDRPLLLGEGGLDDKAVGEELEIDLATATGVVARGASAEGGHQTLTLTNDNPYPVAFEAKLGDRNLSGFTQKVRRKDGAWLWAVTLPANGGATLAYRERPEQLARPAGVEPAASRLEVSCSIQLSYGRARACP